MLAACITWTKLSAIEPTAASSRMKKIRAGLRTADVRNARRDRSCPADRLAQAVTVAVAGVPQIVYKVAIAVLAVHEF
jgi:hypothetical protein